MDCGSYLHFEPVDLIFMFLFCGLSFLFEFLYLCLGFVNLRLKLLSLPLSWNGDVCILRLH